MKKLMFVLIALALLVIPSSAIAGGPDRCATIQDGTLYASTGELITPGYDEFGYNYQAHMFNGRYCDYDRVIGGDSCEVNLVMKWNDAWLSNMDCDGDYLLDRYYGYDNYIGSGAWLTNQQSGQDDGKTWTYFVKIVAMEEADVCPDGAYPIWGAFCVIQEVNGGYPPLNEPYGGNGAVLVVTPAGFGAYPPQ
jgi:hypothetical protein